MQDIMNTMFLATASSIQSSDLYMTIETPMFSVPSPNLNGVRCTMSFLDDIIENQERYIGLPLVADVANLEARKFDRLGHKYNQRTGTFGTSIIGSFYKFDKETRDDGETYLIGYARVLKRNKETCAAIAELFAEGGLKFSFEISCGSYKRLSDGTTEIAADPSNYLEGCAIVSSPACREAVAYQLVAEEDESGRKEEVEPMENEKAGKKSAKKPVEQAETVVEETNPDTRTIEEEVCAETEEAAEVVNEAIVCAEEQEAEPQKEQAAECNEEREEEEAECKKDDCAEVIVHEEHEEEHIVTTYDTETGIETRERIKVEESITGPETTMAEEEPAVEEAPVMDDEDHKTASDDMAEFVAQMMQFVAETKAANEALQKEIAEIKESLAKPVLAEQEESAVNPFMADISVEEKKYRLLEEENRVTEYTLL